MKAKFFSYLLPSLLLAATLASCSGRTDKNMTPSGETIEVVIPEADQAEDAAIATGGEIITIDSAQ